MKKLLLLTTFAFSGALASAQCTPDPFYADSVFGVWPDTTENFMPGVVGLLYSDTLNLIVPANSGDIPADPPYPSFPLDSIQLEGVSGLPPGISVICNSQTAAECTYLPTQLGCGLLQGTPTQTGTFPLTLDVRAWATIPFLGVQSIPVSFDGYEIVISDNTTAVLSLTNSGLSNVRNIPNPFASRTMIEFNAGKAGEARIRVFNLVGEEMWSEVVQTKVGQNRVPFDGAQFPAGVYLYKIESGSNTFTGRMALQR
jgi:Secretion system C-terminal sorting domain